MTALLKSGLPATAGRHFSTSSLFGVKRIVESESGDRIVVEGRQEAEQLGRPCCGGATQSGCHPFCQSPLVNQVKHTDVLILDQFVDSTDKMYARDELRICKVGQAV